MHVQKVHLQRTKVESDSLEKIAKLDIFTEYLTPKNEHFLLECLFFI